MDDNHRINGKLPAVVKSYSATDRTCKVEIPGLTDGADELLEAEIEYSIGDNSRNTEIRILTGDTVWVEFINGDVRYPIITGWRNPRKGNSKDWRKWQHKNIALIADSDLTVNAKNTKITSDDLTIDAKNTKITSDLILLDGITTINTMTVDSIKSFNQDLIINGNLRVNGKINATENITAFS